MTVQYLGTANQEIHHAIFQETHSAIFLSTQPKSQDTTGTTIQRHNGQELKSYLTMQYSYLETANQESHPTIFLLTKQPEYRKLAIPSRTTIQQYMNQELLINLKMQYLGTAKQEKCVAIFLSTPQYSNTRVRSCKFTP